MGKHLAWDKSNVISRFLAVVPAAISFEEGQDDAPAPFVRNGAEAPDRLKDVSEPFHAVRAPVLQQLRVNVAYAWGFSIL